MEPATTQQEPATDPAPVKPDVLVAAQIDFQELTLNSMLMDIPSHHQTVSPETLGSEVAGLFEAEPLLPGVIVEDQGRFIGVVSRDMFYEKTGKLFGTEVFLVRPIRSMLVTMPEEPLVLPETTLITLATQAALSRPRDHIYQPIVIEKSDRSYHLVSALVLFMAQSHQLTALHNQRLYTVEAGQKISKKEAVLRFMKHVGRQAHFDLPMFVKVHSIRCDHCNQFVNYSIIDIVRSFPAINQGVTVEEKMGSRTYRMYVRHRCMGELWEIPVHHDDNLEYRSQRAARIVETYV